MKRGAATLILASKSKARQELLKAAGLEFQSVPANIDERAIEENFKGSPPGLALELARQKALSVSAGRPGALVIGSDQVLAFEGTIMHKASGAEEAIKKLRALKGKTHELISAAAVAVDGAIVWHHVDIARLAMHDFNEDFLANYASMAGDALTRAVGGYELETLGSWLFEKIEGDYFTVLGLPLLPFLGYLGREHGFSPKGNP